MATATKQPPRAARDSRDHDRTAVRRWLASLGRWLERPMMSYQLVIGVSALLLGLGLVMVLSASSVLSYEQYGSSYYIFGKQAMWAAIGLPLAPPERTYTVAKGDSLTRIAAAELGDPGRWPELYRQNRGLIRSPDLLQPGWTLRLPPGGGGP